MRLGVPEAVEEFRAGRPIIIVDDEDRENEGDVAVPAQFCTPELVNFMAMHARGLICVPLADETVDRLRLPMMTRRNTSSLGTAFTISVEAASGITTGISARDRARTIDVLADPDSQPADLVRPGHIFPLRARTGGVLVRAGQTEASVDLCRLAGLEPAAVICEVMRSDGEMARMPDLKRFARRHDLGIITVAEIIAYRMENERLIERVDEAILPTAFGEFRAIAFRTLIDQKEHIALVMGEIEADTPVLVRVHDQCVTGDAFGSQRCDCGEQLDFAMQTIASAGHGVFLYMDQEGRGIGLHNKIRAYRLQDEGLDTVEANEALGLPVDRRDYGIGCQILVDLGIRRMRLMTNNPQKRAGLEGYGLVVEERVPIEVEPNAHNLHYLRTKRDKMGHLLPERLGRDRSR
ncbi:MAG: bifunctional 3,4-dihydroxy-2-butanone-4-phosphate synthase/GTP cyclohydrolase II [Chloroflexi bacterium]|nr:bifunctional 3,4-dihydroxy-2-butanone-4-phosphate synthase/GTP cyclohydrolase II [Chloroflexota bacterium]